MGPPIRRKNNTRRVAQDRYEYQLMRRFGMTIADYVALLIRQRYCCAICGRHRDELKQDLVVDHDHKTGRVRGLLCKACNQALGLMQDNTQWLSRAIDYLDFSAKCAVEKQLPNDV